jgi:hypothetical protein
MGLSKVNFKPNFLYLETEVMTASIFFFFQKHTYILAYFFKELIFLNNLLIIF